MIKIGNNILSFSAYSCQPKTKKELKEIINERIRKQGANCDLNDIDVSLITNMSYLFYDSKFNGDISCWNVSNVIDMNVMFAYSRFDGDISKWDVSKVRNMTGMFTCAEFNKSIEDWDVNNVNEMSGMFERSEFNGDISRWNTSNVESMESMFHYCIKLTSLNLRNMTFSIVTNYTNMFYNVKNDCEIIANSNGKTWLNEKFSNLTNVIVG